MSEYKATIEWTRESAEFDYRTYNRTHTLSFEGGIRVREFRENGSRDRTRGRLTC